MHHLVIILLALAGGGFCLSAVLRWQSLARPEASPSSYWWPLWTAFACLTVATTLAIFSSHEPRDLGYGALAVWAGIASLLFISRWSAMPSNSLLVLPIGAVALMVATAGATGVTRPIPDGGPVPWIILVHAGFMTLHVGAMLVAGSGGGLYLLASAQLKRPSPRALRLPNLPVLERLTDRAFLVATALLLGGLATGGAAMHHNPINLSHPTAILGIVTLAVLTAILTLRGIYRLGRRGMAIAAVMAMIIAVLSALSQVVLAHG